jgi:hypothetical protein
MIGTAMKHLLLFILFMIHLLSQAQAYIHPHDINHAFFTQKVHRARRCHDDCSLIEFNGEF